MGECIYGGGERFTPFIKNGPVHRYMERRRRDGPAICLTKCAVFYEQQGLWNFVNTPDLVSFEIGSEKVEETQFSVAMKSWNM